MSTKTLYSLVVVLALLVGAAYWMKQKPAARVSVNGLVAGDIVFPDFDVNKIHTVELTGETGSIKLRRGEKVWVVEDLYDYPALFAPLAGFLRKLNDLKISQVMREGEARVEELGLVDGPDTLHVRLAYADDRPDVIFTLGAVKQPRSDPGMGMAFPVARFMRVSEGPSILVDATFTELGQQPVDWVDRELAQVSAHDVIEVAVQRADERYVLTRAEDGTYRLDDRAMVDAEAALKLYQSLQWLRFDSVLDPSVPPDAVDAYDTASFKTRDGLTYTMQVGREEESGGMWLRMQVADSSEDGRRTEDVMELNQRHEAWRYKMPSLSVRNLVPEKSTLVKQEEQANHE